jgi:hypothetical protein
LVSWAHFIDDFLHDFIDEVVGIHSDHNDLGKKELF